MPQPSIIEANGIIAPSSMPKLLPILLLASATVTAIAQQPRGLLLLHKPEIINEPTAPPPQRIHLLTAGLSFDLPAGWNAARRDGELSTFALDARSSLPNTHLLSVAQLAFNPFPYSTFAGALFYSSSTPHSTALQCSNQATAPASHPTTTLQIGNIPFKHGYNEHGEVCTEERDEVYTALRGNTCFRFDLVINTFCGGEISGSRDMTPQQLEAVRHRLESILNTVTFDTK